MRFVIKSEILHSHCVSYKDKYDFGLGSDDHLDRLTVLVRLVERQIPSILQMFEGNLMQERTLVI